MLPLCYINNLTSEGFPSSPSAFPDEFTRAVYVATGLHLTRHVVNTVFRIFDEDNDDKLSYKEFLGVMKERLQRSEKVSLFLTPASYCSLTTGKRNPADGSRESSQSKERALLVVGSRCLS